MELKNLQLKKLFAGIILGLIYALTLNATNYYVNPSIGKMRNNGSFKKPWSTLEAIFTANKIFKGGDTIFLFGGYHGYPKVKGFNNDYVTIMPIEGETPKLQKLIVQDGSKWIISGLTISPEFGSEPLNRKDLIVDLQASASYITVENCHLYSAKDITGWTVEDFTGKLGTGLHVNSPNSVLTSNYIKETNYAVSVNKTAINTVVSYNTLQGILGDGIRGLASDCLFEYNVVKQYYGVNNHHDDGFQSWSWDGNPAYKTGTDTVKNITLRGNKFIDRVKKDVPFPPSANGGYGMQGIGCFDGFYENFRIENNLILTDMWHGITIFGALNCTIINNTVLTNPINEDGRTPWIAIYNHKNGNKSHNNLIRNNIVSGINQTAGSTVDNNIVTSNYEAHFVDYMNYDFHLKALSSAINAGSSEFAPTTDLDQNPRVLPYDIGCYEFISASADKTPPSPPTDFDTLEVKLSGVKLSWNPSPESDVIGYRVYSNGKNPVITRDTFAIVKSLVVDSVFTFTVTAVDSSSNESNDSKEVIATIPLNGELKSEKFWNTIHLPELTGVFVMKFDVIPLLDSMDGIFSMSQGSATGYSSLACIIRFNTDGKIDVRDGKNYVAANEMQYKTGLKYHIKIEVNVNKKTYSVFITPEDGAEIKFGKDLAFRTEQINVTALDGITLYHKTGALLIKNLKLER